MYFSNFGMFVYSLLYGIQFCVCVCVCVCAVIGYSENYWFDTRNSYFPMRKFLAVTLFTRVLVVRITGIPFHQLRVSSIQIPPTQVVVRWWIIMAGINGPTLWHGLHSTVKPCIYIFIFCFCLRFRNRKYTPELAGSETRDIWYGRPLRYSWTAIFLHEHFLAF
jgi:hypothetical protein